MFPLLMKIPALLSIPVVPPISPPFMSILLAVMCCKPVPLLLTNAQEPPVPGAQLSDAPIAVPPVSVSVPASVTVCWPPVFTSEECLVATVPPRIFNVSAVTVWFLPLMLEVPVVAPVVTLPISIALDAPELIRIFCWLPATPVPFASIVASPLVPITRNKFAPAPLTVIFCWPVEAAMPF